MNGIAAAIPCVGFRSPSPHRPAPSAGLPGGSRRRVAAAPPRAVGGGGAGSVPIEPRPARAASAG